jgi:hypothetical protein
MMVRLTLIGLLCLSAVRALCQYRKELVQLSYTKKLHGVHQVPFNDVTVIDNRFDTTKLKIMPDGSYPMPELVFDRPASIALSDYIKRAISQFPRTTRHLYIDLLQLRFGNIGTRIGEGQANNVFHKNDPEIKYCLFLSANAYYADTNGGFKKVFSFKRPIVMQIKGLRGDFYQRTIIKALTDFITALCAVDEKATAKDADSMAGENFGKNVIEYWASYPINKLSVTSNGIYPTFDDFLNNRIRSADFTLRQNEDSTWILDLPAGINNPWGVHYNGIFYYALNGPRLPYSKHNRILLPMTPQHNTFFFYLPHTLPDMYAILSAATVGGQGTFSSSPNPGGVGGLIIGAVGAGVQAQKNHLANVRKENVLIQGLRGDLRHCFLDMDSGDVVYN